MAEKEILDIFKLDTVQDDEILRQLYGEASEGASQEASLQAWLSLLPGNISAMIQLALRQERPFLLPGVTPEMMAETNDTLPCMNHIEILYRCIAKAAVADMDTMAALIYVVDRAAYRFGASRALLQVLNILLDRAPHTPVAPQVIIRKARVMKDDGDLHGAVRVLDAVITRDSVWDYRDDDQYNNVKAVCVQIKGHILHNLGMWKDAIEPLVESVDSFNKIHDDKGTSSSLGLLTKCLKKLTMADYNEMKQKYPTMFSQSHPCYEAYVKGMDAVKYIVDLGQTLYVAKHQLVAEESLLMFALQKPPSLREFMWFQTIVADIKKTLATHETVSNLKSLETYFEFVKAIFLIHLTLYFSPFPQDRSLSKYLEQVSIELYRHLCSCQTRRQLVTNLEHTRNSVSFMNASLGILGLPMLQGTDSVSVNVEVSSPASDDSSDKTQGKADTVKESSKADQMSDKAGTVPAVQNPLAPASIQNPGTFPGAVKSQNPKATDLYSRKYIGLTVDASSFSTTSGSSSQSGSDGTSSKDPELVNLSVISVSATMEKFNILDLNSGSEILGAFNDKNTAPATLISGQTSHRNKTTSTSASSDKSLTDSSASRKSTSSSSGSAGLSSASTSSSRVSGESGFSFSPSPTQHSSSESSTSYVDLSATTEEWHNLTDETGELSPLVDLSSSTVNSSLEGLHFGHSVETRSAEEYLEHWEPPTVDETIKVNKALLLTYNPVTGDWLSQSTLVHRGQELDLGGNRKGNCREVFEVYFLHQDEPLGRYVCKRYWQQRPARYYQQDVVCQMMAGYYVTRFNQALHNHHSNIQMQFLPAAHLQLLTPDGLLEDWVNVEPYLHGDFIKLTNNLAFSKKGHHGEELATALTHFSYCESQGVLMIVDIQGWFPREGSGIIYLTDPQFHTKGVRRFSPADKQDEGMTLFWSKVHPECNSICSSLGLTRPQQ
ncbi:alpha-protein kinase 1-like [Haliotis rufescens]|uniref:alpha-protein kinase 1-like n=1 Tax=Haliotis rufescens TaxID=6454 RepID=UPI00201F61CE|nr:alpha-protein kinase 1-like [Haliotis rufescens]